MTKPTLFIKSQVCRITFKILIIKWTGGLGVFTKEILYDIQVMIRFLMSLLYSDFRILDVCFVSLS